MITIEQLPFSNNTGGFKEIELYDDLSLSQWVIPKGTKVKIQTTRNFGFCVLPVGCKDIRGFEVPRRIFKY